MKMTVPGIPDVFSFSLNIDASDKNDCEVSIDITTDTALNPELAALPYGFSLLQNGDVKIGCKEHSIKEWRRIGQWTAGSEGIELEVANTYTKILDAIEAHHEELIATINKIETTAKMVYQQSEDSLVAVLSRIEKDLAPVFKSKSKRPSKKKTKG